MPFSWFRLSGTFPIFMGFLAVSLGFLGSLYFLRYENTLKPSHYSTEEIGRSRDLTRQLHRFELRNAQLESQITELNVESAKHLQNSSFNSALSLNRYTGQFPQSGPGIKLILTDNDKPLLLGDNPNTGIIHNTDLVEIVNELRSAGAKAIAINDQPVLAMTSISCSGPIISINGSRVGSPFTVIALGDSRKMQKALEKPNSFVSELRQYGIQGEFSVLDHAVVPGGAAEF